MTISEIKDIVVGLAAIITASVAVFGIKKWETELRGKAYFEAAKNLVKALYKLRNEIGYCRSPFISSQEFPPGYFPSPNLTKEEEGRAWAFVYKNRWEPLGSALQEFDAALLEAEALWGNEIKENAALLRSAINELSVSIDAVIEDKFQGGANFQDRDFAVSIRANVSSSGTKENKLTNKFSEAIEKIENEIKPHLRRK